MTRVSGKKEGNRQRKELDLDAGRTMELGWPFRVILAFLSCSDKSLDVTLGEWVSGPGTSLTGLMAANVCW